jgi:hypothetical protein
MLLHFLKISMVLTDVNITESSQSLAELLDLGLVGLDLVALGILGASLLLGVEAQVLEKNDLAAGGLVDGLLDFLADAVLSEDDFAAEQLLELWDNRLQAVLGVGLAVGTAEVGHEDDSLGALFNGILDGGQSTDDTLGVGDGGVVLLVEGDIEVNLAAQMLERSFD